MKKINKILLFMATAFVIGSCSKIEDIVTINPSIVISASLSANTLTLLKDNVNNDALTITWQKPDYGFAAAPAYSVYLDKKGNNFSKAKILSVGSELKKVIKVGELNAFMIELGILPEAATDLEVKVESVLGPQTVFNSAILALKATAYSEKLDLATTWGIVGDATVNGWNGPDLPMYKSVDVSGELVGYVTLKEGQIKFRQNNDWAVNLGSTGSVEPDPAASGKLAANGKNLGVKAGTYRVTMNPTTLTYKIESYTWGIVGDATTNGWNGPDMPFMYDATVDLWRTVATFKDGQIKFRQNNDWAVNYGSTGSTEPDPVTATGGLAAGGKNFGVKAGTYLITLDLKKLKYTLVPYSPWGIVGDATTNGWNGPDQKFTYDLSTETWKLDNITLKEGQVKFRQNDAWTNNLGSTGSTEPDPIKVSGGLTANGKNFGVTVGTWSFELNMKDANNPTYKAVKK